jgi:hypothetical protein
MATISASARDDGVTTVSAGFEAIVRAADEGDPRYVRTAQGDILLVATGEYLRTSPRPGAPVRAWHGVIPSPLHRAALQADAISLLCRRAHNDKDGPVGENTTFWIDYFEGQTSHLNEKLRRSRCSLERLALDVLAFHMRTDGSVDGGHVADGDAPHRVRGVEWWVQVRTEGGQPSLNLHFDADEEHKNHTGVHIPPWLATVTYLGSRGAPTLILPAVGDSEARAQPCDAGEQQASQAGCRGAFVSHPKEGKHLVFDGRLLHGAIDDLTHPAQGPSREAHLSPPYTRVTLMVNIWVDHKPSRAMRLPEDAAAMLSDIEGFTCFDTAMPVPLEAAPRCAPPAPADNASGGAKAEEWRELAVGFIPLRDLCRKFPDWRRAAETGIPSFRALFFHPALQVRFLPWSKPSAVVKTAAAAAAAAVAVAAAAGTDATTFTEAATYAAVVVAGAAAAAAAPNKSTPATAAALKGAAAAAAVAVAAGAATAVAAPKPTPATVEGALGLLLPTAALKLLAVPAASLVHYEAVETKWA